MARGWNHWKAHLLTPRHWFGSKVMLQLGLLGRTHWSDLTVWLLRLPHYMAAGLQEHCKEAKWVPHHLLWPNLWSYLTSLILKSSAHLDSRQWNLHSTFWWDECQSHVIRRIYGMRDNVVGSFGKYNQLRAINISTHIFKILSKGPFFTLLRTSVLNWW